MVWDNVPAHIVDGFYANGNMRYTASQWQVLENLGCAFLPATGADNRHPSSGDQNFAYAVRLVKTAEITSAK